MDASVQTSWHPTAGCRRLYMGQPGRRLRLLPAALPGFQPPTTSTDDFIRSSFPPLEAVAELGCGQGRRRHALGRGSAGTMSSIAAVRSASNRRGASSPCAVEILIASFPFKPRAFAARPAPASLRGHEALPSIRVFRFACILKRQAGRQAGRQAVRQAGSAGTCTGGNCLATWVPTPYRTRSTAPGKSSGQVGGYCGKSNS